MRPDDLLAWLRATPFTPFRIMLNSGRNYEIKHPEVIRVLRTSFVYFTPTGEEDLFDRAEMVGLMLIERIEPIGEMAGQLASPQRRPPVADE